MIAAEVAKPGDSFSGCTEQLASSASRIHCLSVRKKEGAVIELGRQVVRFRGDLAHRVAKFEQWRLGRADPCPRRFRARLCDKITGKAAASRPVAEIDDFDSMLLNAEELVIQ